jgi:hypothetical protein
MARAISDHTFAEFTKICFYAFRTKGSKFQNLKRVTLPLKTREISISRLPTLSNYNRSCLDDLARGQFVQYLRQ